MTTYEQATSGKVLLSREECANIAGVDEQTIDRQIKRGVLPVQRIGRRVLIRSDAFHTWLFGDGSEVEGGAA